MRWPWIRRDEHDRLVVVLREAASEARDRARAAEARVDRLLEQLLAMRREGFAPASKTKVVEAPDPVDAALHRAEAVFIANARRDLEARGASPAEAEREARRLRQEAIAQEPLSG